MQTSRDYSRPVQSGSRVIDLSDAGVSRTPIRFRAADTHRPASTTRSTSTPLVGGQRELQSPGTGRSLSQTLRSRVSTQELSNVATREAQAPAVRSKPVTREDIMERYRPSGSIRSVATEATPSRTRGATGTTGRGTTGRGATGSTTSSISRPSNEKGLSDARRASLARQTADRVAKARADKQASDAQRAKDARADKKALDADRAKNARAAYLEKNDARAKAARQNYLDSLSGKTGTTAPGAGGDYGDGYDDGYGDGFDDGHHQYWYWDLCWGNYGSYWNYGYWGWNWCGPTWSWSYWWHCYWHRGGYWNRGYRPNYYWYGPFHRGSSVVVQVNQSPSADVVYLYEDPDPEVIYVAAGEASAPLQPKDEVLIPTVVPQLAADDEESGGGLNRAADYFLTLGDRAFRDGRYGQAVHDYAKAIEYAPEEGILYLILSDALFATGDYHYAAHCLRKALELDPALTSSVVDKRSFYTDPTEFDRQIAVLERYLEDHFLDDDARLVLAANYLYGGRPAAAVDLLESPFSMEVKKSSAGTQILKAAQAIQYGVPAEGSTPN